ncbi:MAG: ABC transporter ATP-binding protein [Rhizobiales bacterium]|nr:ABC transporter ATP-binding protein [Hyphomicrobiales bacterium]
MASSIDIRSIAKHFGGVPALDDVSLSITPGEFLTLLGPSGSGKTTLLMCIAGFVQPDAGSILVDGNEILTLPAHRRNLGMVFQSYALFPHMTVGENVAYPLKLRGVSRAERERRAREALGVVQMDGLKDRRINQLSGGQRQRVAFARAVVFEPAIILMDEPLSALDKRLREDMQIELKHLHQRLGRTIVYVTHDQKEALTMSDHVAVMERGRIMQVASPRDIYERPTSEFVARFIGDAAVLPIAVDGRDGITVPPRLLDGPRALPCPALVVRPEKVEILDGEASHPDVIGFDGEVREVIYQGDTILVFVKLPDGQSLSLRRGTRHTVLKSLPARGEKLRVGLRMEDACVIGVAG